MDLVLVRHAEPVRVEGTGDEPADPPLTPTGAEQARRVGAWLATERIDHAITSPLRRARETAEPLLSTLDLEAEVAEGIGEFDARDASYIPFEEIPRDDERFRAMVEGRWTDVPGWTDPEVFKAQVIETLEGIVERFAGKRVAVFTHAGVVNTYLAHVIGIDRALWFYPAYASISRVAASRRGDRGVVSVNEHAHLDPARLVALDGGS